MTQGEFAKGIMTIRGIREFLATVGFILAMTACCYLMAFMG